MWSGLGDETGGGEAIELELRLMANRRIWCAQQAHFGHRQREFFLWSKSIIFCPKLQCVVAPKAQSTRACMLSMYDVVIRHVIDNLTNGKAPHTRYLLQTRFHFFMIVTAKRVTSALKFNQ